MPVSSHLVRCERGHPWSIDLVVVMASGILLIGLACASRGTC